MPDWLTILGQTILVAGASFIVITLVASHLRYEFLVSRTGETRSASPAPPSAFEIQVAQRLSRARREKRPLMVVRFAFRNTDAVASQSEARGNGEVIARLADRLKRLVRSGDLVMPIDSGEIGAVLFAGRAAAGAALGRILREMSREPLTLNDGTEVHIEVAAGAAFYPEDGDRAADLCDRARQGLSASQAGGGGWSGAAGADGSGPESSGGGKNEERPSAMLDSLTGVIADARKESVLQKFVAMRRRAGGSASILVADVDMLRRYNAQYGREAGDELLREFARFLQRNTRETDLIARGREDQFIVALDCPPDVAIEVARRLWNAARRESFGARGLRLTVTIGVAGWPGHSGNARALLEEAQTALLVGKSRGRNQCVLFEEPMRKLHVASAPADVF